VEGVVDPHIGFELWMPQPGWNGRLLSLGSGGFGGTINEGQLAAAMIKGYAVTANDTGHTGRGYAWMHDPVALRAWGHSATHAVTGPVKAIVRAFYTKNPAYSYFEGCSTGGAQAMEEAEFYPGDYDGIVAGSPGMNYSGLMMSFLWGLKSTTDHGTLSPQKLQVLHTAVMGQCDAADGVKDGLLENPLACDFHPEKLLCAGTDTGACLTREEVKTAELVAQGPRNPRTGAQIYPGFAPGSEASGELTRGRSLSGWGLIQGSLAKQYAVPLLKNMVFGQDWDWTSFNFDSDYARVESTVHADIDATNPDLRAFQAHGGKLIMTQGWGDQFNAQTYPIEYRNEVVARFAASEGPNQAVSTVNGFFRLFMVPGMGHCGGGTGPTEMDTLGAVRAWVEAEEAPDRLVAKKVSAAGAGSAPMTRPMCPYPEISRWTGQGATNDARNFVCAMPDSNR
jgi:feruloyl esterase